MKYWLYLEPYTFLFRNKEEVLLYNSLSFKYKIFKNEFRLKQIISRLSKIENMYCVELNKEEISRKELVNFIKYVRHSFSGDLINSKILNKPIIFPPVPKLQLSINILDKTNYRDLGEEIKKILKEVNIYVGGNDPHSSLCDIEVFKQFDYCKKNNQVHLPINSVKSLLKCLKTFYSLTINIIGGNIFTYHHFDELIEELKISSSRKYLYVAYKDIPMNPRQYSFLEDSLFYLKILIDFPIDLQNIEYIINDMNKKKYNIVFLFAITSETEYNEAFLIINKFHINQYEIKPVYTVKNHRFFEKFVYLTEKDIQQSQLSKDHIFLNQILNTKNFGKLRVFNDGKVYSGYSNYSIGSISEPINNLVYKAMGKPFSWLKTRIQKPCKTCLYHWICPPPSGYEHAIGKANLCHVKRS